MKSFWLLFLLLPCFVAGAVIEGSVYDFGLEPVDKAVVSINTVPAQNFVARQGAYRFSVPLGNYTIRAGSDGEFAVENVTIVDDGSYVIDLVLLPDLSAEERLIDMSDMEIVSYPVPDDEPEPRYALLIVFASLAVVGFAVFFFMNKRKKVSFDVDPQLRKILDFIDKEGGRTTQKDIYKNLPWSESKVSLMLDDLESKCLIRRVKKGRSKLVFRR